MVQKLPQKTVAKCLSQYCNFWISAYNNASDLILNSLKIYHIKLCHRLWKYGLYIKGTICFLGLIWQHIDFLPLFCKIEWNTMFDRQWSSIDSHKKTFFIAYNIIQLDIFKKTNIRSLPFLDCEIRKLQYGTAATFGCIFWQNWMKSHVRPTLNLHILI